MQEGFQTVNLHGCASGVIATPVIGQNGNWFIGNEDTEVKAKGIDGAVGEEGPQGIKGDQGDIGPAGSQGLQGIQGEKGTQGEKGEQGLQGEKGELGVQGEKGENGLQGIQGEKGTQGEKGEQGLQGEKGELGVQGEKGENGLQGIQGLRGEKGEQGLQGMKGEQGLQGEKGTDADSGELERLSNEVGEINQSLNDCDFITEGSGVDTKYFIQKGADSTSKKLLGNRAINFSSSFTLQTGYDGGSSISIPLFRMFKKLDISASGGDPNYPFTISVTGYRDDGTSVSLGSGSTPSFTKNNVDVHEYKFFTINTYRSGAGLWGWSGSYVLKV